MKIKVEHRPSYALGIVELDGGESVKAETGAMVSMSSNIQVESGMQRPHRQLGIFFLDDAGYPDFGCADHDDIDVLFGQGGEHFRGDARMAAHADADNRNLGDVFVAPHFFGADFFGDLFFDLHGGLIVVFGNRKRQVWLFKEG